MSRKERERLVVLSRVKDKQGEVLGLSLRQMHRVYRRYLASGEAGLVHGSRGRASSRRIDEAQRTKALAL